MTSPFPMPKKNPRIPFPSQPSTQGTTSNNDIPRGTKSNVYIAVMGSTGSGKSAFINSVSGSTLGVSDGLKSCTQSVEEGASFELDGQIVTLIDTPGFDDTDRSEVEILKLIAMFLEDHYVQGTTLHGVIYLHRIADNRMGGSSRMSFRMFRKLCGTDTLKNVLIVTTMWDKVSLDEGEAREEELKSDDRFFKLALDEGATMARYNRTPSSARSIVRTLFSRSPLPLELQVELVDEVKHISATAAGLELRSELEELAHSFSLQLNEVKEELTSMRMQTTNQDTNLTKELADELRRSNAKLARVQNELRNLQARFSTQLDVRQMWKAMSPEERLATMFRRVNGAEGDPDKSCFWAALGDTTKPVRLLEDVFDDRPMPLNVRRLLLDHPYDLNQRQMNRDLNRWIQDNTIHFKNMTSTMDNAVSRARKKESRWSRLTAFIRF